MSQKENLPALFIKYVSLNVLSMLGLSLYVLADTFFVANGIGSNGLTALNLALPVFSFVNGLGLMLGMGGATRYAILKSRQKDEGANHVLSSMLLIGLTAGVLLFVCGILLSNPLSVLLGSDTFTHPLTSVYVRTILCFAPAFITNNIFVCFVRNDGKPQLAMAAMLAGSFSNILLDYVFVFPLNMGMFGAAFATGLSPIISMIVMSGYLLSKKKGFKISLRRPNATSSLKPLTLGVPSFITEFSSGIIILLFNMSILSLTGNIGVAAYGIVANIALVATALFTGISQGIQPLISRSYGLKNTDHVKRLFKYGCITALIMATIMYVICFTANAPIIAAFNEENNSQLANLAAQGIKLYFLSFPLMGINIVATSLFSSTAQARQSFTVSILRGCIVIIPLIFLLPIFLGMNGVWLTIPLTEIITFFIVIYFYRKSMIQTDITEKKHPKTEKLPIPEK